MTKPKWTPWREVVTLRDEIKGDKWAANMFAADLHEVVIGRAEPVYRSPDAFFGSTFATRNLLEMVKEVASRLAGQSDRAVRQLDLIYGGGKTHALITLYHLFHAPQALPRNSTIDAFRSHCGISLPRARIAVLPFDK